MHPDFGGEVDPGSTEIYGFPYIVVDGTQRKKTVQFDFSDESDGVDHDTDTSFPFYPIPAEAETQNHWIEEGHPGNVDLRDDSDRHMLIVDKDNKRLYELYNVWCDPSTTPCTWFAGSGAFFDMNTNNRRPEGWTSADAAGLAILPGLVRHDEVYGSVPIRHAFRVTMQQTNGYVYPASHVAGGTSGALPMGARLRLKASTDISSYVPEMQRVFQAMKTYGLIVADNGSNMYVSGTFDTQWDNADGRGRDRGRPGGGHHPGRRPAVPDERGSRLGAITAPQLEAAHAVVGHEDQGIPQRREPLRTRRAGTRQDVAHHHSAGFRSVALPQLLTMQVVDRAEEERPTHVRQPLRAHRHGFTTRLDVLDQDRTRFGAIAPPQFLLVLLVIRAEVEDSADRGQPLDVEELLAQHGPRRGAIALPELLPSGAVAGGEEQDTAALGQVAWVRC
jgi:hypothetical protein